MSSSSRYTPIWNKLKLDGTCKIAAHPALHARIVKAVKKRKNEDLAFKFSISESQKVSRLTFKATASEIIFYLKVKVREDWL